MTWAPAAEKPSPVHFADATTIDGTLSKGANVGHDSTPHPKRALKTPGGAGVCSGHCHRPLRQEAEPGATCVPNPARQLSHPSPGMSHGRSFLDAWATRKKH